MASPEAEMITCTFCSARAYGLELRLCGHCGNGYCVQCHSNDDYCPACVQLHCKACNEEVDRGKHHICNDCEKLFCDTCYFEVRCIPCTNKIIRDDVSEYVDYHMSGKQADYDIEEFITWLYATYTLKWIWDNTGSQREIKKRHDDYLARPKNPELSDARIGKILWVIN